MLMTLESSTPCETCKTERMLNFFKLIFIDRKVEGEGITTSIKGLTHGCRKCVTDLEV